MRVTVFTPTYNRGYIIEQLYHSLQQQTYSDFEWVVVDDGSTDNTEELFDKWIENDNNSFSIIYKKIENGGKHRAINYGLSLANGELFAIVDSDDYLTNNAIERICYYATTIPDKQRKRFAGVKFLRGKNKITSIGDSYPNEYIDLTYIKEQKIIKGDKFEVVFTDVFKTNLFPEFAGEKFITEDVVWNRISHEGYKFRCINEIIYICEYREDGLTAARHRLYQDNPKGYGIYIHDLLKFHILHGMDRIWTFFKYYNTHKDDLTEKEIADYLNWNMLYFKVKKSEYQLIITIRKLFRRCVKKLKKNIINA